MRLSLVGLLVHIAFLSRVRADLAAFTSNSRKIPDQEVLNIPPTETIPALSGVPGAVRVRSVTHPRAIADFSEYLRDGVWHNILGIGRVTSYYGRSAYYTWADIQLCSDCTVLAVKGEIVDRFGTVLNGSNGLLLEEYTGYINGLGRGDPLFKFNADTLDLRFDQMGVKDAGFYIAPSEYLVVNRTLRNMLPEIRYTSYRLEFEYLPGKPAGYQNIRSFELKVNNQRAVLRDWADSVGSDRSSPAASPFMLPSGVDIAAVSVHLVSGGTALKFYVDDNLVCNSKASYGTDPMFVATEAPFAKVSYITGISPCFVSSSRRINNGNKLSIEADHDFASHKPIRDGKYPRYSALGTAIIYVTWPMPV